MACREWYYWDSLWYFLGCYLWGNTLLLARGVYLERNKQHSLPLERLRYWRAKHAAMTDVSVTMREITAIKPVSIASTLLNISSNDYYDFLSCSKCNSWNIYEDDLVWGMKHEVHVNGRMKMRCHLGWLMLYNSNRVLCSWYGWSNLSSMLILDFCPKWSWLIHIHSLDLYRWTNITVRTIKFSSNLHLLRK